MLHNQESVSINASILPLLVVFNAIILQEAIVYDERIYWALTLSIPLLAAAVFNVRQTKHTCQGKLASKARQPIVQK